MKRIYITLIITGSILFTACDDSVSGIGSGTTNIVPTRAVSIYPTQNQLCTENTIDFQWNASKDANGDDIEYTLRIYTDFPSLETYENVITTTDLSHTVTLEKGKAYYWEVIASDGEGEMNGDLRQFYTESDAIVNYVPFSAEVISPETLSEIDPGSTVLEWSCTDLDDDPLTYNVYFGTDETALEMVAEAISETSFEVTTEAETQYYWSVTAQDPSGTATKGQVWSFYTKE